MSVAVAVRARPPIVRRAWRGILRVKLALVDRHRYASIQLERIEGLPFIVLPDVFNPSLLRSGEFLARHAARLAAGARVLELGSGAGAAAILAAKAGCRVSAVDINPSAVRCTRINALLNNVELDVRLGDLFGPVHSERFDVVLFNPPYYRGTPVDALDHAWRSPDVAARFAAQLGAHLTVRGRALVVLSSDGDQEQFLDTWRSNALEACVVAQRDLINETLTVYEVRPRC